MQQGIAARERTSHPGESGSASLAGGGFQKLRTTEELTGEPGTPAQNTQNVLIQGCVVEPWRSVQLEVRQEKVRLASEVEAMQRRQ